MLETCITYLKCDIIFIKKGLYISLLELRKVMALMELNKRLEELSTLDLSKYDLIKTEKLEDINSIGLLLKHKKSGARVVIITNDDENKVFSIGFKTPPYNNTGLQHIIEHSTLCGSRKYPVKDPFVELYKGSLNTFLNAMTYPDKTVYPVASCNDADFKNITDVYMDAVFYPNIYKVPEIFKQEGWHYELENAEDDIKFNGVVFNEMKGVYSSPDDVLSRQTFVSLFPDTAYKNESGGVPSQIPDLTYQEFLDYHKNYYHPVNSYIYIYGDIDVQERLDYLDKDYLSAFDKDSVSINSDIELQKPFDEVKYETHKYSITDDEPLTDNTYLSYNMVVGTSLDDKLYLAMQILDYALILAPGAKLKQALLDKGIGTDIESSYESSMYQPMYSIIAKNAQQDQRDEFVKVVREVLTDIVENGIDERMILAGINYYEFKYREADFGPYPKGLMYYLTMMDSWLYDENKPFIHIEEGDTFNTIRKEASEGLFENIIKEYMLDNNHASVISLVPEHGLEKIRAEEEAKRLADYKASLTDEQINELVEQTKALKLYQDEPSSQEDLEKIPMLKLSDINRNPAKFYIDKKDINGVDVIHHNMFTNKIAYIILSFDCKNVPDELISYIGLLSATIGLMDTENFTYPELTNEININCGGITADASIYTDSKELDKYSIRFEIKGKVLYEKMKFVLDMMNEIIFNTKYSDYKRLKEIIARIKSRLESTMTSSGHTVAMLNGMAQFSETSFYSNKIRGYEFYRLIQDLDKNFEAKKEEIANNLKKTVELIFTRDNLKVSLTADEVGYKDFVEPVDTFIKTLNKSDIGDKAVVRAFEKVNNKKAFTSSSQVQYVARCGNFVENGYSYTGALKLLKIIFSYDYLWLNVRVKGGAYGCMSGFYRNGDTYMVSYRDPNLKETNQIFEQAADYVANFNVSDRDMVKFIIGTIGDMDTPMNPAAKGSRSFSAYICNSDYETLKKERAQVIDATVEDIRNLAPLIKSAIDENYLSVVGSQTKINENSEMFDEIVPLFIS